MQVPQRDVERPVAHVVELPRLAFEVVVDQLALLGLAADQVRRQHERLAQSRRRADPVGDVFAAQAVVGHDGDRVLADARLRALGVPEGPHARPAHGAQVDRVELEDVDFDFADAAHRAAPARQVVSIAEDGPRLLWST